MIKDVAIIAVGISRFGWIASPPKAAKVWCIVVDITSMTIALRNPLSPLRKYPLSAIENVPGKSCPKPTIQNVANAAMRMTDIDFCNLLIAFTPKRLTPKKKVKATRDTACASNDGINDLA